ncbi:MAG: hypothetical protein CMQ38_11380 [Gammaproteobacteria bacterium]|nr:hypothetical protein [Gammaproteobacteria bacterium]
MKSIIAKNIILGCIASLIPLSLAAQNAADNINTLFTTPAEREYLDFLRQEFLLQNPQEDFNVNQEVPLVPVIADDEEGAQPAVSEYTLTGIFTQRNGARTIWLNGGTYDETALPDNMQLITMNGMTLLRITTESGRYDLKAGQSLEVSSGEIRENWNTRPTSPQASPTTDAQQQTSDSGAVQDEQADEPSAEALAAIENTESSNPNQTERIPEEVLSEIEAFMQATGTSNIAELREFMESRGEPADAPTTQ